MLALCALYLLLAMGLVLLGSGVYQGVADLSRENSQRRTALSYLVNQVRRGDAAAAVVVGAYGDGGAVALAEGDYVTYLYCYDGQLMELYTEPGTGLTAADGVPLLPLEGLEVSLSGGLITFTAGGDSVSVAPRCGAQEVGEL